MRKALSDLWPIPLPRASLNKATHRLQLLFILLLWQHSSK